MFHIVAFGFTYCNLNFVTPVVTPKIDHITFNQMVKGLNMKLTDRQVKNLKAKTERYEVMEGNGFGIRVFPTGKKSWVFMCRFNGKLRRITFGSYPQMTVAEAHAAYGKALADLEKGIDVGANLVIANKENRNALTVSDLIQEYIEKWAKPNKRSWKEDSRILNKDVIVILGNKKAREVTKRDIIFLLDQVCQRGSPIAANRTLAVVRRMFNFAVERDILEFSPCYKVKAPAKENRCDRMLANDEIRIFWNGLGDANMFEISKIALQLQLVTAQRKAEIVSAEWDELDLKDNWWTIPAEKAKNGRLHRVPLSDLALQLLEKLKPLSNNSRWLFPSPKGDAHIAPTAIDHALRRNLEKFPDVKAFTPHDLRRTAASHMTALGISRLVVSKLLNHVENSVTAIYDRHSYDEEKRLALNAWSKKLATITTTTIT
jgi:integrase